jgi:hypothetical protein
MSQLVFAKLKGGDFQTFVCTIQWNLLVNQINFLEVFFNDNFFLKKLIIILITWLIQKWSSIH